MTIPTYDRFIEPVLRYLAKNPGGALARDAYDAAADSLSVTQEEREELLPSGAQAVYKNRVGWAHDRLKRSGYSSSPRRGFWQLTAAGQEFASKNPGALSEAQIAAISTGSDEVRLRGVSGSSCLLYTSPSPRDRTRSRMPSSA